MKTMLAVFVFFLAIPTRSIASDGQHLMKWCEKDVRAKTESGTVYSMSHLDWYDAGYCSGLVSAIVDLSKRSRKSRGNFESCVPEDLNSEKAVEIVLRYLKRNKASLSEKAETLVERALVERFPCK